MTCPAFMFFMVLKGLGKLEIKERKDRELTGRKRERERVCLCLRERGREKNLFLNDRDTLM